MWLSFVLIYFCFTLIRTSEPYNTVMVEFEPLTCHALPNLWYDLPDKVIDESSLFFYLVRKPARLSFLGYSSASSSPIPSEHVSRCHNRHLRRRTLIQSSPLNLSKWATRNRKPPRQPRRKTSRRRIRGIIMSTLASGLLIKPCGTGIRVSVSNSPGGYLSLSFSSAAQQP